LEGDDEGSLVSANTRGDQAEGARRPVRYKKTDELNWILANLIEIRMEAAVLLGKTGGSIVGDTRHGNQLGSALENVAIRRAQITSVLDAIDEAITTMPGALKRVYRMRFRARMSISTIGWKLHYSRATVSRRLSDIRGHVEVYLRPIPRQDWNGFCDFTEIILS
jgi:DNA-directed RNA polymerase specialized sigma24 family protein